MSRDYVIIRGHKVRHTTAERDWVCSCGSGLTMKPDKNGEWGTVCVKDNSHEPNTFITKAQVERNEHQMWMYQKVYEGRKERGMAFVKDRHDEHGKITDSPRVRRAGRIALGIKREGGGAESLPYFRFVAYEKEALVEQALLNQVYETLERHAPGQDVRKPSVLPVYLAADNLELVAGSIYKLAGKGGRARCVGDGETIQYKLGPGNLIEVSSGMVAAAGVKVDGREYNRGDTIACPGRSYDGRWNHCDKCGLKLTIDVRLIGLPYIWSLTTGDQDFYNQFFTVISTMEEHIMRGDAMALSDIPLVLRKEDREKARPQDGARGTELRYQEMHLLSVEIHPVWVVQKQQENVRSLAGGEEFLALTAPDAVSSHDISKPGPEVKISWIHDDGLPGVPYEELSGEWGTKEQQRESILASAQSWLGMSRNEATTAIDQYKDSVKNLKDLWACLRQHVAAPPEVEIVEAEVVEAEEPQQEPQQEPLEVTEDGGDLF